MVNKVMINRVITDLVCSSRSPVNFLTDVFGRCRKCLLGHRGFCCCNTMVCHLEKSGTARVTGGTASCFLNIAGICGHNCLWQCHRETCMLPMRQNPGQKIFARLGSALHVAITYRNLFKVILVSKSNWNCKSSGDKHWGYTSLPFIVDIMPLL